MPNNDEVIEIYAFSFDFDNCLNNYKARKYFFEILKDMSDWQFFKDAAKANYTIDPTELANRYSQIIERLKKIDIKKAKSAIVHYLFLEEYNKFLMQLVDDDDPTPESSNTIMQDAELKIYRNFAAIINRLDPSLFAQILILANEDKFQNIEDEIKQAGVKNVSWIVFSNRGSYYYDIAGMQTNATMSAYTAMLYIRDDFKRRLPGVTIEVSDFCAADIYGKLPRGTSYRKILEEHASKSPLPLHGHHAGHLFDEEKGSLKYMICHDSVVNLPKQLGLNPKNVHVTAFFLDDLPEVIHAEDDPSLFPNNVVLKKILYDGKTPEQPPVIVTGSGSIDYLFAENTLLMAQYAGHDLQNFDRNTYQVFKKLPLSEFLAKRKTQKVGVFYVDNYLQNVNYENFIADLMNQQGTFFERCSELLSAGEVLSQEDQDTFNNLINASMSIHMDSSLTLSRDLSSSMGLIKLPNTEDEKYKILMDLLNNQENSIEDISSYKLLIQHLARVYKYEDFCNFILLKKSTEELSATIASANKEILRDFSLAKYKLLLPLLGDNSRDIKETALFCAYRPIFRKFREKFDANEAHIFRLVTNKTVQDELYDDVNYIYETAKQFFLLPCEIVAATVHQENDASCQYVPITCRITQEKPVNYNCYKEQSACLMWSGSTDVADSIDAEVDEFTAVERLDNQNCCVM